MATDYRDFADWKRETPGFGAALIAELRQVDQLLEKRIDLRQELDRRSALMLAPLAQGRPELAGAPLQVFTTRPDAQAIIASHRIEQFTGADGLALLVELAGRLCDRHAEIRRTRAISLPDANGRRSRYLEPSKATSLPAKIASILAAGDAPFAVAVQVFFAVNQAHLFHDGSGRTARALFILALRAQLRLDLLYLPLGPLLYLDARALLQAYERIALENDWSQLVAVLTSNCSRAATIITAIAAASMEI